LQALVQDVFKNPTYESSYVQHALKESRPHNRARNCICRTSSYYTTCLFSHQGEASKIGTTASMRASYLFHGGAAEMWIVAALQLQEGISQVHGVGCCQQHLGKTLGTKLADHEHIVCAHLIDLTCIGN